MAVQLNTAYERAIESQQQALKAQEQAKEMMDSLAAHQYWHEAWKNKRGGNYENQEFYEVRNETD